MKMIFVNDEKVSWQEGMTVRDLLDGLEDDHDYAVVRVNGKYVSKPHFDEHQIPDMADIYLIPMVAGG
jgi:thiamine biosynthesis protein ThiS